MLRFSQIPVTLSVWTSFSRRLKQNKTKQNLHVQTKVSIFRPPLQIPNAQRQRPPPRLDNRTARSYPTTRAPRSETQGPEPTGKPGPACRVRPGPSFQWNRREWGREGAEARVQTAATELRLVSLPGVFGLGEVHPDGGRGQAGFSRRAGGRCEAQAAGRRELAGLAGLSPQSLKALSMRLPPPKMATWAAGEPGRRGWGRGEKRRGRNKKVPPPHSGTLRPAREPVMAGGGTGGERGWQRKWAYFFLSFAPPAPSMANRSPWSLHGRPPPGSLRPNRWLLPQARREGEARPEVGGARRETPRKTQGGGAGGNRKGSGPAPKSLPSGCLSRPGPTHWPKQRRGRSSRLLRRGGSVHWGAEAAAGGGQGRRRARRRAGDGRGERRVSGARPPAYPGSRSRKPASPEGEAGSLRANGEGRRRPVPPQPTSVSANQEAVSWGTAGTRCRAHVLVCVQLWRKEKGGGVRPTWVWGLSAFS